MSDTKYAILFGSTVDVVLGIMAIAVAGYLFHNHSSLLLDKLQVTIGKDYNITFPPDTLQNNTDELQQEIGESGMECSTQNSIYLNRSAIIDSLTVDALNATLNDTISGCMNRTMAIEQLVALVGMELTPNLPTLIVSGTVTASLDGSGSVATTYTIGRLVLGIEPGATLGLIIMIFPEWSSGISTFVSGSSTLRYTNFSPPLTNMGMCSGVRPILVNRFDGIDFKAYELDCSTPGGQINIYGPGVTTPGTLELNQPLNLFGQFL